MISAPIKPYWSFRDELSTEDSLVLKGGQVIIPTTSLREGVLQNIHQAHQGIEKSILRAKTCVYWPNITTDITNMVNSCEICQHHQPLQQKETLLPHKLPTRSWHVIGSDLFYIDSIHNLLVADYYTKFPFVRKMKSTTSQAVIEEMKSVFGEHGIPEKVVTDNGPQYASSTFAQFSKEWNFNHVTSSPTNAQSNGFIERMVRTVEGVLKKASHSNTDPEIALLCLRTTPIDHYIPSPSVMLYNKMIRSNLPLKASMKHHTKKSLMKDYNSAKKITRHTMTDQPKT